MRLRKVIVFALVAVFFSLNCLAQEAVPIGKAHSPKRATAYSAILPGLGQVYNRQAWKVPVIYALGGATAYVAVSNYRNAVKFKNEYYNRLDGKTEALLPDYATYSDESILSLHEAYNKNFQLGILLSAAVYMLNIVDAMVYGHLFDFEINDNLAGSVAPFAATSLNSAYPNIGLSLSIRIK